MQIGIIGLGWMGAKVALRLLHAGHRCVVYDRRAEAVEALAREGATGFGSAAELAMNLSPPRVVWLMLPADATDPTVDMVGSCLDEGDLLVDAGDSHFHDDRRRARSLALRGVEHVDVGISGPGDTSHGYCVMVGGAPDAVSRLTSIFESLAPGPVSVVDRRDLNPPLARSSAGYLHCGPSGAGHFVKIVHDGIQRRLMDAYAEGFNVLQRAHGVASGEGRGAGPDDGAYEFDVPGIAELWRHGSVIQSAILDLAAAALTRDPALVGWGKRAADLVANRSGLGPRDEAGTHRER